MRQALIILVMVCLAGCDFLMDTGTEPDTEQERLDSIPVEAILDIPTYDGSGQAVHPDVIYFPQGFRGNYFYMAMTPYPFSDDQWENPSILVSRDGYTFREEVSGINPLVGPPPYDHNDDTDLAFVNGEFRLIYLETMEPDSQNVILLRSKDGIEWDRLTLIHYDLSTDDPFIVSPAMVERKGYHYLFYVVGRWGDRGVIRYLKSPDGMVWSKKAEHEISTQLPEGFSPWHLDVFKGKDQYYMLCNGWTNDVYVQSLYLATSTDLEIWRFVEPPLLEPSEAFYDSRLIYRGSGIVRRGWLIVWFSFMTHDGVWRIGVRKFHLSDVT